VKSIRLLTMLLASALLAHAEIPEWLVKARAEEAQHRAKQKRNPAARRAFVREHPCPATGKTSGACPGYVVDHIKALAWVVPTIRATCNGRPSLRRSKRIAGNSANVGQGAEGRA
jgi:hypothetical protein